MLRAAIDRALRRLRKQPSQDGIPAKQVVNPLPVLVVSTRMEDHQRVRESLEKGQWLVIEAHHWSAALNLSRCVVFPVIVCDRDFEWPDGHGVVPNLTGGCRAPSVILLADRCDSNYWESVLQEGGFDVLIRPLHSDDVLAVLDAAYRQWADGRASQTVPADSSLSTLSRSRTTS